MILEIKTIFTVSLNRTVDKFDQQQRELVGELKTSAQEDRAQHGKLFADFATMSREVVIQLTNLRQEFLAAKPEHKGGP